MTFVRSDQIQAAFLTDIKSRAAVIAEVAAAQIKETQPQTTEFTYPGIRIRVGNNSQIEDGCPQDVDISVYVFSEHSSSQEAMRIAGIIQSTYDHNSFSATGLSQTVLFTGMKAVTVPVVRQDRRTWRSEVILTTNVSSG